MAFDPTDYRGTIALAGGDYAAEYFLRSGRRWPLWGRANLDDPDLILEIAAAFIEAGSDILVTNTDNAHVVRQAERIDSGDTSPEQIRMINHAAASIARKAAECQNTFSVMVLGTMGPVDRLLSLDEISKEVLRDAYQDQAKALAEGGADGILCRGFSEIDALAAAVEAARDVSNLPIIAGMIFDCGWDRSQSSMGVTVPQACEVLTEVGVAMIGCDSGEDPDHTAALVSLMRESTDLPIWCEIHAGRPELQDGRVVYPEAAGEYAKRLTPVAEAGASLIAGGLGVTVEHIAALTRVRDRYLKQHP